MTELSDRETLDKIDKVVEDLSNPCRFRDVHAIKSMKRVERIIVDWRDSKIDSAYPTLDGCCKVVDIAADLQRELDESKFALDLARTTHGGTIKYLRGVCDTRDTTIEKRDETIRELKRKLDDVSSVFDDQNSAIEGIEVELSARKEDSEVLTKVVEAVRKYDGSYKNGTMNSFTRIYDIVVDYLDAPEDTPIDEPDEITVTFAWL